MKGRFVLHGALLMVTMVTSAGAVTGPQKPAATTPIRTQISLLLELHNMLRVGAKGGEDSLPTDSLEVAAYRQAHEMTRDPAVWQIVDDACVLSKDISGIRETKANLPGTLAPTDRDATLKILTAIETAWPRFEANEMVARNRSLQTAVTKTLRRIFTSGSADRVFIALQDKMNLKPLDAPVTVYPVISAIEAGDWGVTPAGYYLVLPVRGRSSLILTEDVIHEMTHLLDGNQPPGSVSMLTRLRQKAAGADPAALDEFMHGLVAWNAGEMVKRFINPEHKTVVELSPQTRMKMEPYLPIYSGAWVAYLEGKATADQTIDAMITAFKKVPVPKPQPEEKQP